MDFLSNVKRMFFGTTEAVAKKTGEIVEKTKVKYSIFDIKGEIDKIYTDMGRELYKGYVEGNSVAEYIEEKCTQIDELREKMEALKEQLPEK